MMDMKKNLKKRKEKSSTLENNNKTKKINVDNTWKTVDKNILISND